MPRENVEFEFPDPDKDEVSQEVEVDIEEEDAPLEIEGAVGREDMKTSPKKAKEDSFEIEMIPPWRIGGADDQNPQKK